MFIVDVEVRDANVARWHGSPVLNVTAKIFAHVCVYTVMSSDEQSHNRVALMCRKCCSGVSATDISAWIRFDEFSRDQKNLGWVRTDLNLEIVHSWYVNRNPSNVARVFYCYPSPLPPTKADL